MAKHENEKSTLAPMNPSFHFDLEDVKGLGEVEIEDRLILKLHVKVNSISKYGDPKATSVGTEVMSVEFEDREMKGE